MEDLIGHTFPAVPRMQCICTHFMWRKEVQLEAQTIAYQQCAIERNIVKASHQISDNANAMLFNNMIHSSRTKWCFLSIKNATGNKRLLQSPTQGLPFLLIPILYILQPSMRPIRILFPLRPWGLQSRLLLTSCH